MVEIKSWQLSPQRLFSLIQKWSRDNEFYINMDETIEKDMINGSLYETIR